MCCECGSKRIAALLRVRERLLSSVKHGGDTLRQGRERVEEEEEEEEEEGGLEEGGLTSLAK